MVGKPYRVPSAGDRLRRQQKQIKDLQAIHRSRNTPKPEASTAFAGISAAGSEGGTGNFLAIKGDTMVGPLALAPPVDFRIQIDSDGIINIGESSSNSQYTSNIQLDDVQPNTFVLDTIAGAAFDGQILVIRTFAPSTPFTIAQATFPNGGNIQTLSDSDFTMGNLQTRVFIFDASLVIFDNAPGGTWREIAGGVGGGDGFSGNLSDLVIDTTKDWLAFGAINFGALSGVSALTMTGDINVSTFDVLNIDRATFADDGSSITANSIAQILLNSSGSFQTNVDTGDNFVWTIFNDTILTVQEDVSNNSVLTLQSLDDTGGAVMEVFRNDIDGGVPAGIVIGSYGFQTGTTVASNVAEYASIQSIAEIVTTSIFEGSMDLLAADGSGGQSTFISINDGANNLVDIFKVLDMNANKILNVVDPTNPQDAATKNYVDTVGTGANTALSNLASVAINTSLLPGVDNSIDLGSPSFQWESIYLAGNIFFGTSGVASASDSTIWTDATGDMVINVADTDSIFFSQNNVEMAQMKEDSFELRTATTNGPDLILNNNDPSIIDNDTVAQIFFKADDNLGVTSDYGAIEFEANDITSTSKQGSYKVSCQNDNVLNTIIDYSGADATFRFSSGVDVIRANSNGTKELGTSSFFWDDVFTETLTLRGSGGDTTGTKRAIYADSDNIIINMPTGNGLKFTVNGVDDTSFDFSTSAFTVTRNLKIINGVGGDTLATFSGGNIHALFGTNANPLRLQLTHQTSTAVPYTIGTLDLLGLNSVSSSFGYARIEGLVIDDTDGSEDGGMEIHVAQSGTDVSDVGAVPIMKFNSSGGTQQIGFFGTTPISKPNVVTSGDTQNDIDNLLTALVNLGLITTSA